jgi:hypothetical protein
MNVLILGGMSPWHHDWVREVAAALEPHFDTVKFLDYRHWQTGTAMDIEHEVAQAVSLAEDLGDYVLVAKSIGTAVGTLAISRGLLHPKHCVFMGFPLAGVVDELPEVADALPALPPTMFVHNEFDTVGAAEAVQKYLREHRPEPVLFITVPGNTTHDYTDYELLVKLAVAITS